MSIENNKKHSSGELFQWLADTSRLLKIALRTHDPDSLDVIYKRMAEKWGEKVAEVCIYQMITHLMNTEDWDWIDENGNPSPLLSHELPDIKNQSQT